jgi:hypothetical protein
MSLSENYYIGLLLFGLTTDARNHKVLLLVKQYIHRKEMISGLMLARRGSCANYSYVVPLPFGKIRGNGITNPRRKK